PIRRWLRFAEEDGRVLIDDQLMKSARIALDLAQHGPGRLGLGFRQAAAGRHVLSGPNFLRESKGGDDRRGRVARPNDRNLRFASRRGRGQGGQGGWGQGRLGAGRQAAGCQRQAQKQPAQLAPAAVGLVSSAPVGGALHAQVTVTSSASVYSTGRS